MASFWRLIILSFAVLSAVSFVSTGAISIKCGVCEASRCPELHYCEGEAVKDHCGCCTVCSSSKFQPHPIIPNPQRQGSACEQVKCPKFKVCVENMQGLPLCTCPSKYICRRRKQRSVCGTDGITYESRCHLRIAACNTGNKIKVDRKGTCKRRSCVSASECRRRKHRMVCGTDGRTYASRCLMKVASCQADVKIKVKSQGACPSRPQNTSQNDGRSDSAVESPDSDVKRRKRRRRGRKEKDKVAGNDENKLARRQRRRERRKMKKEKRRKRRKARGKIRSRRYKRLSKDEFQRAFGHYTWRY